MLKRKTTEEKEAKRQEKEAANTEAQRQRKAKELERLRQAFLETPVGQARTAFEQGDEVFQASFDVMSQEAIIVAMVGSATKKKANDPTAILNGICREGWELVNGSFVFVEEGQQSRDKFMASGQNVATKGERLGTTSSGGARRIDGSQIPCHGKLLTLLRKPKRRSSTAASCSGPPQPRADIACGPR